MTVNTSAVPRLLSKKLATDGAALATEQSICKGYKDYIRHCAAEYRQCGCAEMPGFGTVRDVLSFNEVARELEEGNQRSFRLVGFGKRVRLVEGEACYFVDCIRREVMVVSTQQSRAEWEQPARVAYSEGPLLVGRDEVEALRDHAWHLLEPVLCGGASELMGRLLAAAFAPYHWNASSARDVEGQLREIAAGVLGIMEQSMRVMHRGFQNGVADRWAPGLIWLSLFFEGGAPTLGDKDGVKAAAQRVLLADWAYRTKGLSREQVAAFFLALETKDKKLSFKPTLTVTDSAFDNLEAPGMRYWPYVPWMTAAARYAQLGSPEIYGWQRPGGVSPDDYIEKRLKELEQWVTDRLKPPLSARFRKRYSGSMPALEAVFRARYDATLSLSQLNEQERVVVAEAICRKQTWNFIEYGHWGAFGSVPNAVAEFARRLTGCSLVLDLDYCRFLASFDDFRNLFPWVRLLQGKDYFDEPYIFDLKIRDIERVTPELLQLIVAFAWHKADVVEQGHAPEEFTEIVRWQLEEALEALLT